MKALLTFVFLNFIFVTTILAQCEIRGKVSDNNGETLIGVTVFIKTNPPIGVFTDMDGNYSIKLKDTSTPQILNISYIGYNVILDTINCKKGDLIIKNYVLESKSSALKEVVVTAKSRFNNDNQLEVMKRKSSSTMDFISAETIKKTGDANVGAAIARVTGVSTSSTGIITVRGIGDRYLKTTINGFKIPTLDPFTNNIKLDIFPASLIDNILITKTASPDLPGDWAGAYISVETKDYPDSLSIGLESSFGYNPQTSFKDVLTSERSSTDWLGYDNSKRNIDHSSYSEFYSNPTMYQEFVALGLGDYLKSQGITSTSAWNNDYTKLGLIQLGLLGTAQYNDQVAYDNAIEQYNSLQYKGDAFNKINADAVAFSQSLPNTWNYKIRKAPLSNSQSFSIGNQTKLFGKPLGFLVGYRYSTSTQSDANSIANKCIGVDSATSIPAFDSSFQQVSKEVNSWSALVNVAYKYNPNHSLSLLFMPNVTGINNVRKSMYYKANSDDSTYSTRINQFYESRQQFVYQLKSEHYLPKRKIKIALNSSYTNGKSSAPDLKAIILDDQSIPRNQPIFMSTSNGTGRYFRYLTDNVFDSRLSAELPLYNKPDLVRKLKMGIAYQNNHRESTQYYYQLWEGIGSENIRNASPNADPYGRDRFDIVTTQLSGTNNDQPFRSVQEYYSRYRYPSNDIFGNSSVMAAYSMVDYSIIQKLRVSGGLRVEKAKTYTDCQLFDSLGLAADDPRRQFAAGVGLGDVKVNPGVLNEISYLPSINIIYKLKADEISPINIRANFSQSVARPNMRELSDNVIYDQEFSAPVRGNSDLKMAQINNYDLRVEKYFKNGDNISISGFYKDFKNHIEMMYFGPLGGYIWKNNENKAWIRGIEIEGKKSLSKNFEFKANVTFVNSYSKLNRSLITTSGLQFGIPGKTTESTMLGQAPYILNGMLTYTSKEKGLVAGLSYNVQGRRLVIVGVSFLPDIYELPRNMIDFKISKTIGKHFNASLKIQDLLSTSITRSYIYDNKEILIFDQYKYGTTYVFSLSYKL
ncbi:MAG: carboxypeptidase-like regulatory domain-containing protein [Bacteroidota bacterium]